MANNANINTDTWRLPKRAHTVPEASFTDEMYRKVGLPTAPASAAGGTGRPAVDTSDWKLPTTARALEEDVSEVPAVAEAKKVKFSFLKRAGACKRQDVTPKRMPDDDAVDEAFGDKPGKTQQVIIDLLTKHGAMDMGDLFDAVAKKTGLKGPAIHKAIYLMLQRNKLVHPNHDAAMVALPSTKSEAVDESASNMMAKLRRQQQKRERAAEKKADPKLLARAEEMGRKAFAAGKKSTPAQDPEFSSWVMKLSTGEPSSITPYLTAWVRGWQQANADAPVESVRLEQRRLAGLALDEHLTFATGTPYRRLPEPLTEVDRARAGLGSQSDLNRAYELIWAAGETVGAGDEIGKLAKKLNTTVEKLAFAAYDKALVALKKGARPVSGTKNDLKAEMASLAKSAKALGMYAVLTKVAAKHSPKKESAVTPEMRRLAGMAEDAALPRPLGDTRPVQTPKAHGILDDGQDEGEAYVERVLAESRWFFGTVRPFAEAPGGRRPPWQGSKDVSAETPIVRKGEVHGTVGKTASPEAQGEVDVGRSEVDYDFEPDEEDEAPVKKQVPPTAEPGSDEDDESMDDEEVEGVAEAREGGLKSLGQRLKSLGHRMSGGKAAQRAKEGLTAKLHQFAAKHGIDTAAYHAGQQSMKRTLSGKKPIKPTKPAKPSILKRKGPSRPVSGAK